jgi:hypothetical protein
MAQESGLSKSTVHKLWASNDLKLNLSRRLAPTSPTRTGHSRNPTVRAIRMSLTAELYDT